MGSGARDVVVIGGGLIGATAALLLAEAGLSVSVYEADHVGAAASGRNAGSIQHPLDPVRGPLYEESVELYKRFGVLDGPPVGMIGVARVPEGTVGLAEIANQFPSLEPELLDSDRARELEPELGSDVLGCLLQTGYPTTPLGATTRIAALARELGVEIIEGQPAEPVLRAGRVEGVRTREGTVAAERVFLAAGPWTPGLLDPSGGWGPVEFEWGVTVHIEFTGRVTRRLEEMPVTNGPDVHGDGISERWELTPTREMTVLGATHTHEQPDEQAGAQDVLTRTARFLPAAARAPVAGIRSCARPTSFDGRPLIGRCGADGLYAVTGHGPYGISTGPGSARLGVDSMLHGAAVPHELSWERFAPAPIAS
jgi:glycine/D-amino acid oxidase-like deaminating enzyme